MELDVSQLPGKGSSSDCSRVQQEKEVPVLSPLTSLEGFLRMSPTPPPLRRPWLSTVTMHMSSVSQARSHCSGSASGEESRAGAQSTGTAPHPGSGDGSSCSGSDTGAAACCDIPAGSIPAAPPAAKPSCSSHLSD